MMPKTAARNRDGDRTFPAAKSPSTSALPDNFLLPANGRLEGLRHQMKRHRVTRNTEGSQTPEDTGCRGHSGMLHDTALAGPARWFFLRSPGPAFPVSLLYRRFVKA